MNIKNTLNKITTGFKNIDLKSIYKTISSNKWVRFTLFLYLVCFTMFAYTLLQNNFTIPVQGDFTLQEIPFYYNGYDDWWTSLTTGQFVMWDDSAMLGVNNIGANSFYYLFNPFFLVLLLVPRSILPQAQAFMMITKMVLAGISMKILLEKFKVKEETTWLIAVAYAFCGYNLYYLWFNHFLEITVLMPFVLLGIENVLRDKKPLVLIMSLFITGLTNYFFLIAFCFCAAIYAAFRYFQLLKDYTLEEKTRKNNNDEKHLDVRIHVILLGVFSFACGIMLSCVILFPCFSVALSNSRVTEQTYLSSLTETLSNLLNGKTSFGESIKDLWYYISNWESVGQPVQKFILYPLVAFFTPNFSCYDSVIFHNGGYDNAYASLFLYAPLLLFFIPSVIQSLKKRAISTSIGLIGIGFLLFTPFAYYCFSGFTSVAYARWYVFVTAILCVFIAVQYDKREEMKVWTLDISLAIVGIIYGFLLFKADFIVLEYGSNGSFNLSSNVDERITYMYAELAYIVILYFYLRKHYKKPKLTEDLRYFVAFEAIVMCNITLIGQGTVSYQELYHGLANIQDEMAIATKIKEQDDDYYRVFSTTADRNGNNLGMMLGTPGLGTFHSVYNYEMEDFLDWTISQYGYGRGGWSMGIHEKRINLDQFLGVKYYILKNNDNNIPFGFEKYLETDLHTVYKNKYYVELGYAFDTIIQTQRYENIYTPDKVSAITYKEKMSGYTFDRQIYNEKGLITGAILYQEDIEELFNTVNFKEEVKDFNFITSSSGLKQGIYSTTSDDLSNNDVKVYEALWHGKDVFYDEPQNYEYKGGWSSKNTTNLTWFSYMDVDVSKFNVGSECDTRGKCFVTVQARMGENLEITFYDENDEVIVSDKHMTHWFGKNGDNKRQRGFYVDREVKTIRIRVLETMDGGRSLLKPYITYQYEDTYVNQIDKLTKPNSSLLNVKKDVNRFSFDTNFDSRKMIVLNVPYDKGWSLKTYDENDKEVKSPKIYKGQGGFISFLGEEGEYHYELSYQTPYLSEGIIVMTFAMLCVGGYMLATTYYDLRKNKVKTLGKIN